MSTQWLPVVAGSAAVIRATAGTITVVGVNLRRFEVEGWRHRVSDGFQDSARIELLLRQSVGVGDLGQSGPPAINDSDRLEDALAQGCGPPCRRPRPPAGLAVAERRRSIRGPVAEGRPRPGLLRQDPLVLLLDEPTSGLDPAAEHEVFEAFAEAAASAARRTNGIAGLPHKVPSRFVAMSRITM